MAGKVTPSHETRGELDACRPHPSLSFAEYISTRVPFSTHVPYSPKWFTIRDAYLAYLALPFGPPIEELPAITMAIYMSSAPGGVPHSKSYQLSGLLFLCLLPQEGPQIEKLPAVPVAIPMADAPRGSLGRKVTSCPNGLSLCLVTQGSPPFEKLPAIPMVIPMADAPGGSFSRKVTSYPYGYPYG